MDASCCRLVENGSAEIETEIDSCRRSDPAGSEKAGVSAQSDRCPGCAQKGKRIDSITVKAMLNVSLMAVSDGPYFFCRTAGCPVVYFSAAGPQVFTKDQIRERVHQKEPDDKTVPVCYCFHHSPATIGTEWETTGRSTVVEAVETGIQAGRCACEIRNPQGSCCLGNVRAIVREIAQTSSLVDARTSSD